MAPALTFHETSFAAYVESFPATSVNVAMQVGHNTVRVAVMGLENRAPTAQEQATMERLVEEALDAGAIGVVVGALHGPWRLRRAAGTRGARACGSAPQRRLHNRRPRRVEHRSSTRSARRSPLAERTGARTRIVHAKLSGTGSWGGAPRLLAELAGRARARRSPLDCDHYPYTTALNPLRNLLPAWAQEGGLARMLGRLSRCQGAR